MHIYIYIYIYVCVCVCVGDEEITFDSKFDLVPYVEMLRTSVAMRKT